MARLIDSVMGHRQLWQTLLRQRERGHLPHAMAFSGRAGVGKKRVALALAQALLCEGPQPPCGDCAVCRRTDLQAGGGVLLIEAQNGSIKLEASAQVLQFLALRRVGRARVVVIDDAQLLTAQTTNALLKSIEEPPPETYFILLISELSRLLPTLRSRLQVLRFAPLSVEQIGAGADVPEWMLRSARGSFAQLADFRDEERAQLRALVINFIEGAVVGRRQELNELVDRTKERTAALSAIHFLQAILRDWSVHDAARPIHSDLEPRLRQLPPRPHADRVELWRRSFQLERDFNAHVDRSLLFENFFYATRGPR